MRVSMDVTSIIDDRGGKAEIAVKGGLQGVRALTPSGKLPI